MLTMWIKALRVIPRVSKEEWDRLDVISRWLIASRAAVFIMTATAGAVGGLLAWRLGEFSWAVFLPALAGIVLAHATNNMLNDLVDYKKGIDHNNYYRAQYGPHPLEHGLLSRNQFLGYIVVTGLLALACGAWVTWLTGWETLWLIGAGLFFLLFYTWPLKYIGLGELSVVFVWGPLMVGGTSFVVTGGHWDAAIMIVALVYSFGPTTVLLGKHTDKLEMDREKGVRTLPVVIGEKASPYLTQGLWIVQYAMVLLLVFTREFTPALLIVFLTIPHFLKMCKVFLVPRPLQPPAGYDPQAWPLYLVAYAFGFTRKFGLLFLLGVICDAILVRVF